MKRTLWTAAVTGLLAICASNCGGGGGDENVAKACDKLQSCGSLSTVGSSTYNECVSSGNNSASAAGFDAALVNCLTYTDCTQFTSCIRNMLSH